MAEQDEEEQQRQEDLIAAIAVLIVMTGVTPPMLAPKVVALFATVGLVVSVAVALAVLSMAMQEPIIRGPVRGKLTALSVVQGREDMYRSAYIASAVARVNQSVRMGATPEDAVTKERVHWEAHLDAQKRREEAAKSVDAASSKHGSVLGWYAKMDNRTSAECEAANGHNFNSLRPPAIGYPGSVHRFCRCTPGKPFEGATTVDAATRSRKVA